MERDERGRFVKARADGDAGEAGEAPKTKAAAVVRPRKAKSKAWTKRQEETFFRELSTLCNVSSALRAAKLTGQSSTAYDRRRRDAAFRARWQETIEQSYALLELEMLERARFGQGRPAATSEVEKALREVPTSLGLQLLKMHQAGAKGRGTAAPAAAAARRMSRQRAREIRAELEAKLSELNLAMGGEG